MNRAQLITKVENAWKDLHIAFEHLSDEEICQPNTFGEWSLKDILGHVTTWEAELLTYLPVIQAGERTPRYKDLYGGIDAFNAIKTAEKRDLTLEAIRLQMQKTHSRVLALLESVPEEYFLKENRLRKRIRWDTYGHYKEHTKSIQRVFPHKK